LDHGAGLRAFGFEKTDSVPASWCSDLRLVEEVRFQAKDQPVSDQTLVCGCRPVAAAYSQIYVAVFSSTRAKMILMPAEGLGKDEIAKRLDTRRALVSMWRKRFINERLVGLEERARAGRPGLSPLSWWCRSKLGLVNFRRHTNSGCPVRVQQSSLEKFAKPV
jgi:hypothetical protein